MANQRIIIIGANSAIAKALAKKLRLLLHIELTLISRNMDEEQAWRHNKVNLINIDNYNESNIKKAVQRIKQDLPITQIYICHGLLHNETITPEKKLEDISISNFTAVMHANAITPLLWIQQLTPFITHKHPCKIVVFSARVGSISDNKLGGWYSYRASKAALNMLLKNASIELARRAKNVKLIAFHPGTTDTPLSKPFQKNVVKSKLFNGDFVAQQLLTIVEEATLDGKLSYLDWQGKSIEW